MKILWKDTVSSEFRANRLKLSGNCTFPQNFHTSKLGEITVFFAVTDIFRSVSLTKLLINLNILSPLSFFNTVLQLSCFIQSSRIAIRTEIIDFKIILNPAFVCSFLGIFLLNTLKRKPENWQKIFAVKKKKEKESVKLLGQ